MKIYRITESEFAAMGTEWNCLVSGADVISPMLQWEWCFSWWQSYKELMGAELYVLVFRNDDNSLMGIVPFYICKKREYGLPVKRIQFIGTGEPEKDETCSELLDIICRPECVNDVLDMATEYLLTDTGWDEIRLYDVPDGVSVSGQFIKRMERKAGNINTRIITAGRCPVIRLPVSWDDYFAALGKRTRKLLRYERRRIERDNNVRFEVVDDSKELPVILQDFIGVHQQRWAADGKNGCFASKIFTGFLNLLIERMAANGGVQISTLYVNDDMAASFLLLRFKDSIYFYNSAVDINKYGKLSPGTVGLSYVVEDAIKNKKKEFHFFKGRAGSYKDRWTDDRIEVVTLVVRRKCLVNYVRSIINGVKRWRRG